MMKLNDLAKAIQLRELGRLEDAKAILLELLKQEPNNPSIW
ncbi:tetratricopeptide repeat protein [Cohnella luojiensis]